MARVNRFYNPQIGQYQSQFVPVNLPADLMLKGLANKQAQYDKTAAEIGKFKDWTINALPGYDEKYRDEYKQKLNQWADEMFMKDLSLPQNQFEYLSKLRSVKDDKNLKAIESAYATHQDYLKNVEKLKAGQPSDWSDALAYEYDQRFKEYTKEDGRGFTGEILLGDKNILSGVDKVQEAKKIFDDIKANGSEAVKSVLTEGYNVAYKDGWEGVTDERVKSQLNNVFSDQYNTRLGKQLQAEFDMNQQKWSVPYNQLSKEEKTQYNKDKQAFVYNTILGYGKEFVFGKSTTNKDVALRKGQEYGRQDAKDNPQQDVLQFSSDTYAKNPSYDESTKAFTSAQTVIKDGNHRLNQLSFLEKIVNGDLSLNDKNVQAFLQQPSTQILLSSIPSGDKLLAGKELSESDKTVFNGNLNRQRELTENSLATSELVVANHQNRNIYALEKTTNKTKTSNGIKYKDALGYEKEYQKAFQEEKQRMQLAGWNNPSDNDVNKILAQNPFVSKEAKAYQETNSLLNRYTRESETVWGNEFTKAFEDANVSEVMVAIPKDTKYLQTYITHPDGTVSQNATPKATNSVFGILGEQINKNAAAFFSQYGAQSSGAEIKPSDLKEGATYEVIGVGQKPVNGRVLVEVNEKYTVNEFGKNKPTEKTRKVQMFVPLDDTNMRAGMQNYFYNNAMRDLDSESGKRSLETYLNFFPDDKDLTFLHEAKNLQPGERHDGIINVDGKDVNISVTKSEEGDKNATPYKVTVTHNGKELSTAYSNLSDLLVYFQD